ncbi:MAG TPA: cytochrome c oxidase subunit 3 family protein [Tepidisphaeraceae bacterium]|nr:cytochrome c oxidase subunit 3 family protein [Tepidisphaeraceae bacterium]
MTKSAQVDEQFQDMEQQSHSATLGMWIFLATEILFFGAMFAAYMVCRTRWADDFAEGSRHLKMWIGGLNTFLLLTSDLCMALAVRAAAGGKNRAVQGMLAVTICLALAFLGCKGMEYTMEINEGLLPGSHFSTVSPDEMSLPAADQHPRPRQMQLFMFFYFVMTAVHALHIIVGIGIMLVLIVMARRKMFSAQYFNPVDMAGLYWHFVDIVWVFLYPALYLLRKG